MHSEEAQGRRECSIQSQRQEKNMKFPLLNQLEDNAQHIRKDARRAVDYNA